MKISVKRRTWLLVGLMPIDLKFNGETIGSIAGFQKKDVPISEMEGELTYDQPLDHTDRVQVRNGDIITLKETVLCKIVSVMFIIMMTYIITKNSYTLITGSIIENNFLIILEQVVFILFIVIFVISLFFNSYKFVIENR